MINFLSNIGLYYETFNAWGCSIKRFTAEIVAA
jgi:hypothetical protein